MQWTNASTNPNPSNNQVPAWFLDLLLGIAVTVVIAIVISADQGGSQEPDALAYLFACGFGGLMLARRRFPVLVLVATMFLLFVYYALGYPAIGLAVPVSAALYSAAESGRLLASIIVSLVLLIVSTAFRLNEGQSAAFLFGYELVSAVTMMAAAIALGDGTRSRRALRTEQEQSARLIEQEHAHRTEQRVQAERLRMARDLHDVIGHSISVISLHADVAKEAIGHDNEQVRQALVHIRNATTTTMRELRTTVKLLRNPTGEPAERSIASLTNLPSLLETVTASDLKIDLTCEGDFSQLPATVDSAAYRIIQESLTNVIRHASATSITLHIEMDEKALRLLIQDNGKGQVKTLAEGSGVAGMRERARLLGGTFQLHNPATGGIEVAVTFPLEKLT